VRERSESVGGRVSSPFAWQVVQTSSTAIQQITTSSNKSKGPRQVYFLLKLLFNLSPRVPPEALPPSWLVFGSF
jgi:hypothetical protein